MHGPAARRCCGMGSSSGAGSGTWRGRAGRDARASNQHCTRKQVRIETDRASRYKRIAGQLWTQPPALTRPARQSEVYHLPRARTRRSVEVEAAGVTVSASRSPRVGATTPTYREAPCREAAGWVLGSHRHRRRSRGEGRPERHAPRRACRALAAMRGGSAPMWQRVDAQERQCPHRRQDVATVAGFLRRLADRIEMVRKVGFKVSPSLTCCTRRKGTLERHGRSNAVATGQ